MTGVASTENIITGTAATFNNVVKVGTAITLDATSGIFTVNGFVGNVTGNATGLTGTPDISQLEILLVLVLHSLVFLLMNDVTNVDSVGIVTARSGVEMVLLVLVELLLLLVLLSLLVLLQHCNRFHGLHQT